MDLPETYLLLFNLTAPLALGPVGWLGKVFLPPSLYAYAGSAPTGISNG